MLTYTAFLHLYPHPRRSMQTSASVDADIRVGRCRMKKSNYYIISFTKQQ